MEEVIPANHLDTIVKNIKRVFNKLLPVLREDCKEVVKTVDANLVQSCLNLV